jgi:hypothetical protein
MFATERDELTYLADFIAALNAKGYLVVRDETRDVEDISNILADLGYDQDRHWVEHVHDVYDAARATYRPR